MLTLANVNLTSHSIAQTRQVFPAILPSQA
jgi:hypothetical protein